MTGTSSMSWSRAAALLALTLLSACAGDRAPANRAQTTQVCPVRPDAALRFVDVFDGDPASLATLIPDEAKEESGRWNLGYVYDAGRFVTIRCKYSDDRTQDIKLSSRVSACDYAIDAQKTLTVSCK